jgi:hypothetical protein
LPLQFLLGAVEEAFVEDAPFGEPDLVHRLQNGFLVELT